MAKNGKRKFAPCRHCRREMKPNSDCTANMYAVYEDGVVCMTVPHDDDGVCHDCNAGVGMHHHPGCDWERCPRCGGQMIGCDCHPLAALDARAFLLLAIGSDQHNEAIGKGQLKIVLRQEPRIDYGAVDWNDDGAWEKLSAQADERANKIVADLDEVIQIGQRIATAQAKLAVKGAEALAGAERKAALAELRKDLALAKARKADAEWWPDALAKARKVVTP